ncbi:MAG: hypothetical protein IJZ87_00565 [Bacteroidales bacterium]|nr:hypothetical protein [Bacteroidales bacterium]
MSIILRNAPKQQGYYTIPDLPVFRLRCTLPITAEVSYIHNGNIKNIFSGSYVPGLNNNIEIDLKDILQALLSSEVPKFHLSYITQYNFMKEIYVLFKDDDGQIERTFNLLNINATISSSTIDVVIGKQFLTLQTDVKEVTVDSPEFLTYFYAGDVKKLIAKFYNNNGTSEVVTLYTWKGNNASAITHNVSYREVIKHSNSDSSNKKPFYDIYVVDESNQRISLIQRYVFRESTGRENYYLFYNYFGGLDTFITTGDKKQKPEVTFDIARRSSGLIQLDNTEDHITWNQKSGYFSINNIYVVTDFLLNKKDKYIYTPDNVSCCKIVVTGHDASFNKKDSFTSFSFTYRKTTDIPEIEDFVVEIQQLIIDNMSQSMPLEMPKRGVNVHNNNDSFTTEPIECTMNSVLMYIETKGFLSVYTSTNAETWTLIDHVLVENNTVRAFEDLTIGSYLKVESETPITNIDILFSNAKDNY